MATSILATKLYIPPPRPKAVPRPRLIERLNEGLSRASSMSLICAPAGFGKTTLVSEWVNQKKVAWLSLDEGDNDPVRFLPYLITALQAVVPNVGAEALARLQSPQPPPTEATLTVLLNDLTNFPDQLVLVLDDYHVIEAKPVDLALTFLLEHLPPQLHLVIATREDPDVPLAKMRARGQLTELRAAELRFTPAEAAEFLNSVMGLQLAPADIAALEARTEGWIAGLQLAALSMQGQSDVTGFIQSFTGSHRFVLDYLVEEVLQRQPASVQTFLLRTAILDQMCGDLCDVILLATPGSGQATLESIERANLFIVPLDNERHWYRYHHLFAELLRQRLPKHLLQSIDLPAGTGNERRGVAELHVRASAWYESQGLELEAFQHAVSANDVERAERLVEGGGMPLTFRGAAAPVLHWLKSLPTTVLDARPALWVSYATALMFAGQNGGVEQKLRAAEAAIAKREAGPDDKTGDLIGRIAAMRATLAIVTHDIDAVIAQSRRALEYLHPDNLSVRTGTTYALGYAYQHRGDRAAASQAFVEVIASGEVMGGSIYTLAATLSLGQVQEAGTQLHLAAESYQRALAADTQRKMAGEIYLGLARIDYEWNDLEAASQHAQASVEPARQLGNLDTFASYRIFLARLKLAQGDLPGATALLAEAEQFARRHHHAHKLPEIAAVQVLILLRQDELAAAAQLAEPDPLLLSRVQLARGDADAALAGLEPLRRQAEAKGWADERLKVLVLQALALQERGESDDRAVHVLGEALALAEPGGLIRTFVDEGPVMAGLLRAAAKQGAAPSYVRQILAGFGTAAPPAERGDRLPAFQHLIEPLSDRELEVLRLLGTELGGPAMALELSVSIHTLRSHTKNIFTKLGVNSRRAAVRRAEELNLQ